MPARIKKDVEASGMAVSRLNLDALYIRLWVKKKTQPGTRSVNGSCFPLTNMFFWEPGIFAVLCWLAKKVEPLETLVV